MAILRGGRRIGNYDIRIGVPRDRSLDNVNADERLRRKPGGNPESTINRFIAEVNQGEGLARPNRFMVMFHLPQRVITDPGEIYASEFGGSSLGTNNDLESLTMAKTMSMMCSKVTMPSRDINTQTHLTYGPAREMPYAYSFSRNIELTFYGDKFLRQRQFFENWQKKIFDYKSHNMRYYDDYIGSVDIFQLGQFESENDRDRVTYAVRLFEVYPQTIGSMDYTYGDNDKQVDIPITLNFRRWINLTIDQVEGATIGSPFGDVPTIKASKNFGLFGGVLSKLPPEFRRAGRDILQTAKRSLPIGKVTGGKLFPPF
tara:strand:- start:1056 stop:2000 length:945 start_codon:yes stop_codon:yes gene_type:complete